MVRAGRSKGVAAAAAAAAARMKRMKRASGRRMVEKKEEKEEEEKENEARPVADCSLGATGVFVACERELLHLNGIISTLIFWIINFPTR